MQHSGKHEASNTPKSIVGESKTYKNRGTAAASNLYIQWQARCVMLGGYARAAEGIAGALLCNILSNVNTIHARAFVVT